MLIIRPYKSEDHDAVWNLHNVALWKVGAHAGNGPWDDDLHKIEEVYLNNGGEFLVGLLDGRIVAMGAIKRLTDQKAEVKRMRVHPDYQRRGFGQQILTALEACALKLGYSTLTLDTAVVQTAAQQLYLRNGFHETGRTVLAGFDAILFEKGLD
jgi:GNAT superfamily N-acetyltransferase